MTYQTRTGGHSVTYSPPRAAPNEREKGYPQVGEVGHLDPEDISPQACDQGLCVFSLLGWITRCPPFRMSRERMTL